MGGQLSEHLLKKGASSGTAGDCAFVASMTGDNKDEVKKYKLSKIKEFFVELFNKRVSADFFLLKQGIEARAARRSSAA